MQDVKMSGLQHVGPIGTPGHVINKQHLIFLLNLLSALEKGIVC